MELHIDGENVDLLNIDVEGYDFEIIKTIDWTKCIPEVLIFEYRHLNLQDFKSAISLLKKQGYKCFLNDYDVLCLQNVSKESMRKLKPHPFYYTSSIPYLN